MYIEGGPPSTYIPRRISELASAGVLFFIMPTIDSTTLVAVAGVALLLCSGGGGVWGVRSCCGALGFVSVCGGGPPPLYTWGHPPQRAQPPHRNVQYRRGYVPPT